MLYVCAFEDDAEQKKNVIILISYYLLLFYYHRPPAFPFLLKIEHLFLYEKIVLTL